MKSIQLLIKELLWYSTFNEIYSVNDYDIAPLMQSFS